MRIPAWGKESYSSLSNISDTSVMDKKPVKVTSHEIRRPAASKNHFPSPLSFQLHSLS